MSRRGKRKGEGEGARREGDGDGMMRCLGDLEIQGIRMDSGMEEQS